MIPRRHDDAALLSSNLSAILYQIAIKRCCHICTLEDLSHIYWHVSGDFGVAVRKIPIELLHIG